MSSACSKSASFVPLCVLWTVFRLERLECLGGVGGSCSETLCELAVRWGGLLRRSGYLKKKAQGEGVELRWSLKWSEGGRVLASGEQALYGSWVLLYSKRPRFTISQIGTESGLAPVPDQHATVFFLLHTHGAAVSPTYLANGHV